MENWHLDKKIPVLIVMTILVQTFSAGWWSAGTSQRIQTLEKNVEDIQEAANENEKKIIYLETQAVNTALSLSRIESKLDNLLEREMENDR